MAGWKSCCARARCGWTASAPRRPTASSSGQTLRLPPQVIHGDQEAKPRVKTAQPSSQGSLQDTILYMDKHRHRAQQAARSGDAGRLRPHASMSTACSTALAFEKNTRPKLVHRLDRDTSGVLLIARTSQAASRLSRALAGRDASENLLGADQGRAEGEARHDQGGAGQRGRLRRHGRDERMTTSRAQNERTPNSPSPNMP